jgi:hypothetical protein
MSWSKGERIQRKDGFIVKPLLGSPCTSYPGLPYPSLISSRLPLPLFMTYGSPCISNLPVPSPDPPVSPSDLPISVLNLQESVMNLSTSTLDLPSKISVSCIPSICSESLLNLEYFRRLPILLSKILDEFFVRCPRRL